jgi:hypothetical protein
MYRCITNGVLLLFAVLVIVLGYLKLYYSGGQPRPIVTTQAGGLVKHLSTPMSKPLDTVICR